MPGTDMECAHHLNIASTAAMLTAVSRWITVCCSLMDSPQRLPEQKGGGEPAPTSYVSSRGLLDLTTSANAYYTRCRKETVDMCMWALSLKSLKRFNSPRRAVENSWQ